VAPQVPSGLSPPARVRSCCPATTAPGGEGVVALVRALECNSVREGRGDVPNATGNGGTVAKATDEGVPKRGSQQRTPPERRREAAMKKRPSSRGRPEEERAQSQGRSGVPARATREGAARANKVARAEAEAAEVAGGGSKWQRKSMAAAQWAKPLKKQICQGRGKKSRSCGCRRLQLLSCQTLQLLLGN
jgi:hypothetical protein